MTIEKKKYIYIYILLFKQLRKSIYILYLVRISGYGREPGSSVIIRSGYGLDNWALEVQSGEEAKGFSSSPCVQISPFPKPKAL
jgi:hypothetical protein